jgi:hypothetical protein
MPAGLWDRIMPIMQLTRPRMVQLLNILQLPSPQLDQADRYRLSERVLREVLATPREQWERMIRLAIQNQLTSDEVAEVAATPPPTSEPSSGSRVSNPVLPDPSRQAGRSFKRFLSTMNDLEDYDRDQVLDEIADTVVSRGTGAESAEMLDELSRLIRARLERN